MKLPKIKPGSFLIASPDLLDPNFRRTVVLMCEHGPKGSMGLVLNRPTKKPVREILPEAAGLEGAASALYLGGPVGTQGLMVLHRLQRRVRGEQKILPGVHLGGEQAFLKKILGKKPKPEEGIRVFLGYAGWGAKQLDRELKMGGWIVASPKADLIFDVEPQRLWSEVLWSLGGTFRILSCMPADPQLN